MKRLDRKSPRVFIGWGIKHRQQPLYDVMTTGSAKASSKRIREEKLSSLLSFEVVNFMCLRFLLSGYRLAGDSLV